MFDRVEDVLGTAMRWLWTYIKEGPNKALGGSTPSQRLARATQRSIFRSPYYWVR